MEEMMNDAVDSALDSEDMEEEIEEEVDKVLASVAGETASQLPDAARTQKIQQASTSKVPEEVNNFALQIVSVLVPCEHSDALGRMLCLSPTYLMACCF
jgi:hypothetical protein